MTFEPISTQEEFDEAIKSRLAREREKWQKESGAEDLEARIQAKDEEISTIKREHYQESVRRAMVAELAMRGVTEDGRIQRVMKLVDLAAVEADADGKADVSAIHKQLDTVAADVPELLRPRGAGSGGSSGPVLEQEPKPLTRVELEQMSPEEVNGAWPRVQRFLAGER
jgi:hypothetical protein